MYIKEIHWQNYLHVPEMAPGPDFETTVFKALFFTTVVVNNSVNVMVVFILFILGLDVMF